MRLRVWLRKNLAGVIMTLAVMVMITIIISVWFLLRVYVMVWSGSRSRLGKKSGGMDDDRRGTLRSLGLPLHSSDECSPPPEIPSFGLGRCE